jgi:hypothetical protein
MTSPRPRASTRALRIGVMLADTLVAEHVVRSGRAFTIGQSIRNLVPLPVAGLPRRWQLLELVEHGVLLRLAPGMGARVSAEGRVLGRADLDARGAHTRVATLVTVPAGAHGKIDLGEVRVLFQELRLPAPAPAPTLPRAVKGTLADRVDRRMAGFAAASLLVHVGIMTAAYVNDPPERGSFAQRALAEYQPDTVSIIDADDPILDLDRTPPTSEPTGEPGTAPTPTPTPPTTEPPTRTRPPAAQPTASDPRALAGDATRMADLLFDDGGTGAVDASMARRRPGSDLGRQLEELRDSEAKVAIGNPSRDRTGDGTPRIGTSTAPVLDGPDGVTRVDDDKREVEVPTRITVTPRPPKQPGADIDDVVTKIRTTYMGGLQRCYKKALGPQPTLAGKVTLSFELSEKGKVGDRTARGVDDGFEDCVEGLMTRWSFTPVVDKDGDPMELDIDVTLQLAI